MPTPWNIEALHQAPPFEESDLLPSHGVRSILYESVPWKGKTTRVFAYLGVPDVPEGETVPAMVLLHGGGGTAFPQWVRLWNERGYAAIAMDQGGTFPKEDGGSGGGEHPRHDDGGPSGWGGFNQIDDALEDQWPYHAVAAAVLGHSLLAAQPGVDPSRIGMTGISWGGYLTSMVSGVDDRFRFAVPVYGCGFLGDNSTWKYTDFDPNPEMGRRWCELWDPGVYLPNIEMPRLWMNGTNDFAYPLDSWQKSYRAAPGPRSLCCRVEMPHGHNEGWGPREIAVYADSHLRGGAGLPALTGQGLDGEKLWATYQSPRPIRHAQIAFTRATGYWPDRKFSVLPAEHDAAACRVDAELPPMTSVAFLILTDEAGNVVSSEHVCPV